MSRTKAIPSFFAYAEGVSKQLKSDDRERTGRGYMTVARRFTRFVKKKDVTFKELSVKMINDFQAALLSEGRTMNTVSFYMRNVRAIYNRADRDGLIKKKKEGLFDNVFTGTAKTKKRALTKKEMISLASLEIKLCEELKEETEEVIESPKRHSPNFTDKELHQCLLYFMFGFHGRGISFIDLCFLRKNNIHGDDIHYCRKKTHKEMVVKLTEPMRNIINYFKEQVKDSPYLFPLLDENSLNSLRSQYENILCRQNRRLKEIGKIAGIAKTLSTHVARHSWATIARDEGFGIAHLCQALGHADERTTAIYLASFDESVMDKASDDVSRSITEGAAKTQSE